MASILSRPQCVNLLIATADHTHLEKNKWDVNHKPTMIGGIEPFTYIIDHIQLEQLECHMITHPN